MKYNYDDVCISGYGAITPLGDSLSEIVNNMRSESRISPINKFKCDTFVTKHAYIPVLGNENIKYPSTINSVKNGENFYTLHAIKRLLSNIDICNSYPSHRVGCILGIDKPYIDINSYIKLANSDLSIHAASNILKLNDLINAEPSSILKLIHDYIPFQSTAIAYVGLCAASTQAIAMAVRNIKAGFSDLVITGGVSAKISPMHMLKVDGLGVTANNDTLSPDSLSRPFDKNRCGFVIGEGAIFFALETVGNALKFGRKPLISILGTGMSLCAEHIVAPHTNEIEMINSMQNALRDSGLSPQEIDCINTHGTSTKQNDLHESIAIDKVFHSSGNSPIVTATKSYHGHLMAAAGAMEILTAIACCQQGFFPKILNLDMIDPDVPSTVQLCKQDINFSQDTVTILKNSFGMGGIAASLVLRYERE